MEEGKEVAAPCWSKSEEKPSVSMSNVSDCPLLTDEKFDFDLSLSPASGNEDEVFVGPVGHKEKCIAVSIEAKAKAEKQRVSAADAVSCTWSPLTEENFVEIFREAHLLTLQIETEAKSRQPPASPPGERGNHGGEQFLGDPKAKLKMLRKPVVERSPRAVKRETYCVWDSPACLLPPAVRRGTALPAASDSPAGLRGAREGAAKTPAKLPLGKGSLLLAEKPKAGKQPSSSAQRNLSCRGSSEDPASDKSNAASDVFESSFSGSSSEQGRRVLPAPSKPGLKKTLLKLPGVATGLTRKMTSSSSSSVSSMSCSLNSSLPISPIGKKGKPSTSSGASVSGSRLSCGTGRLGPPRPTRLSSLQAASTERCREQAKPAAASRIPGAASLTKPSAPATSSEAVGGGIQRLSSAPTLQSAAKASLCPKPRARALSVPTSQAKGPVRAGDTPSSKPALRATPSRGATACGLLGSAMASSTPVRAWGGSICQSSCGERPGSLQGPGSLQKPGSLQRAGSLQRPVPLQKAGSLQRPVPLQKAGSLQRPVPLQKAGPLQNAEVPTPVRRSSALPAGTPRTAPRLALPPRSAAARLSASCSARKPLPAGSKQTRENRTEVPSEDEISPPPLLPLALNFSPEKSASELVESELQEVEAENQLTEEKQTEALLVDIAVFKPLPCPLECESRPLIDLSNTPEVTQPGPLKPVLSGQLKLIDLSSPLITLSPDVNKENLDSPLLKF